MNEKTMACWVTLGAMFLTGCGGSPDSGHADAVADVKVVAATGTEQALLAALNAERQRSGKSDVKVSSTLAGLARGESAAAAASGKIPGDTTARLRVQSGFGTVGKLQGALKDRGTQTGKAFVDYWVQNEREMLLDTWGMAGVGVSKAADGRLFAVVILGNASGGGSLMHPAMSPSGL